MTVHSILYFLYLESQNHLMSNYQYYVEYSVLANSLHLYSQHLLILGGYNDNSFRQLEQTLDRQYCIAASFHQTCHRPQYCSKICHPAICLRTYSNRVSLLSATPLEQQILCAISLCLYKLAEFFVHSPQC